MAQYKDLRKTAVVDRHEAQAFRAQSRRGEQRAITVNQVRGNSVMEAAQEAQSEELGKGLVSGGLEPDASNDTPTLVTSQEEEESLGVQDPWGAQMQKVWRVCLQLIWNKYPV